MTNVSQRIKEVKQPHGGYVSPKIMEVRYLSGDDAAPLDHKAENISPSAVGLAVDYLVRVASGTNPRDAFAISLMGATMLGPPAFDHAESAVDCLSAGYVDVEAIRIACQLVNYDVVVRAGQRFYNPDAPTLPDETTRAHIAEMVARSLTFFDEYGPITVNGFTFEGGYTATVRTGDGDFLTADTLWDFKVSAQPPTSKHTLQLLMYYLMGCRSIHSEFRSITHLGVFNPRLNVVYRLPVAAVPAETIEAVSRDVIGYR